MYEQLTWMFLLTVVECIALTLLQIGGIQNILVAALLFSVGVVPLLVKSLEFQGVGMMNFIWNIFTTIIMFAIGIYFFSEKITEKKAIGVLLSLCGIGVILLDN